MGNENIIFLTVWIILGKICATFSSDPEPTTVFGKSYFFILSLVIFH